MKALKLSLAAFALIVLVACSNDPKMDATSMQSIADSYRIMEEAHPELRSDLNRAGAIISASMTEELMTSLSMSDLTRMSISDMENRTLQVLRDRLLGKTAKQIIAMAEDL